MHPAMRMRMGCVILAVSLCVAALPARAAVPKYVLDENWPHYTHSAASNYTAVAVTKSGNEIHCAQRNPAAEPVFVYDFAGNYLRSWGMDTINSAHGMKRQLVNGEDEYVWVADVGDHVIRKFTLDGRQVAMAGKQGHAGTGLDPIEFGNCADLAFDGDGNIYVGDGDGGVNNRVVKLDKNFNVVWVAGNGVNGTAFISPHSVAYESKRHILWVADRGHNRTVALDGHTGLELGSWSCFAPGAPWSVRVDNKRRLLLVLEQNYEGLTTPFEGRLSVLSLETTTQDPRDIGPCTVVERVPLGTPKEHEIGVDGDTGDVYVAVLGPPTALLRLNAT